MPDLGNTSVFSQTDGSNNSGTQPSWSGSAAPSTLDDAGRGLQGAVTREWNWRSFTLTAGGTADAKTLTYSVAPAAYYNGQRFAFLANTTNTGSATLNVNSLGAKTIKKDISGTLTNLSASDMVSGMFVEVAYNTANDCFVWVNRGAITQALGTGDSPQFAGINVGNASDTTITRSAAGVIAVEGGIVPKEDRLNTFSVDQTVSNGTNGVNVSADGSIELFRSASNPYIDFKTTSVEDYDCRIQQTSGNGLQFFTGGNGSASVKFTIDSTGNALNSSAAGGLGYGTGSGGTVTQITSKATGVTLDKTNGQIITHNASLGAASEVSFTVTNSTVAATDNIILTKVSGGTATRYQLYVGAVAAGSFVVSIRNVDSTAQSDVITFNFAVIKSVTS